MKTIISVIVSVFIGFGIGYFISKPVPVPQNQTTTATIVNPKPDSTYKPKIQRKDSIIYRDIGTYEIVIIHDSIPVEIPVDTPGIVADYLLQRDYIFDTTLNEVKAHIIASVFANKLTLMQYSLTNLRNCHQEPKWNFKIGANVGINDFSPGILFEKNKFTYQVSYDLIGIEKGIKGGIFYGF